MRQDSGPTRVCLFALHCAGCRIPAHTVAYLRELSRCGWRLHVACNGWAGIGDEDRAFLHEIGAEGYARANTGLDFGAWAALLRRGCAAEAGLVLFANDSVLGPFGALRPILTRMEALGADAWGMVESRERVRHLQSWFVCISGAALARPAVRRVFAQDFDAMGKDEIILHGELGLSVALRAERLRIAAAWPERARLRRVLPVNPSHFDWQAMLRSGEVPFIKTALLRDNPANIGWIGAWRETLAALPGEGVALVNTALAGAAERDWQAPVVRGPVHRRVLNTLLGRRRRRPRGGPLLQE